MRESEGINLCKESDGHRRKKKTKEKFFSFTVEVDSIQGDQNLPSVS